MTKGLFFKWNYLRSATPVCSLLVCAVNCCKVTLSTWKLHCCNYLLILQRKVFTPITLSAYLVCALSSELGQPWSDRNRKFLSLSWRNDNLKWNLKFPFLCSSCLLVLSHRQWRTVEPTLLPHSSLLNEWLLLFSDSNIQPVITP